MPRASQGEGDFSGTVCLHGTDGLFEHETSQSWSHPSPTMSHCYCYTADFWPRSLPSGGLLHIAARLWGTLAPSVPIKAPS